jgi:hypothetical protein
LTTLVVYCGLLIDKRDFDHSYEKYWDKYTEQQLIVTLYSDTLMVDTEGGWTTREFYIKMTKNLNFDTIDKTMTTE